MATECMLSKANIKVKNGFHHALNTLGPKNENVGTICAIIPADPAEDIRFGYIGNDEVAINPKEILLRELHRLAEDLNYDDGLPINPVIDRTLNQLNSGMRNYTEFTDKVYWVVAISPQCSQFRSEFYRNGHYKDYAKLETTQFEIVVDLIELLCLRP